MMKQTVGISLIDSGGCVVVLRLQHGRVGAGADRRRFAEDRPFVHVAAAAEQLHGQRSVNETTLALDAL
jgi:hypothetical protein